MVTQCAHEYPYVSEFDGDHAAAAAAAAAAAVDDDVSEIDGANDVDDVIADDESGAIKVTVE